MAILESSNYNLTHLYVFNLLSINFRLIGHSSRRPEKLRLKVEEDYNVGALSLGQLIWSTAFHLFTFLAIKGVGLRD